MSFDYLSKELDKLYEREIPLEDTEAINQHCEFISEFIRAAGWTEEEIVQAMFQPYYDMLEQGVEDIKDRDYWNPDLTYPIFKKDRGGIN